MNGLPDRKITRAEVEALRNSKYIAEVTAGHRYTYEEDSGEISRIEVTLHNGETEELMYFGEDGEWDVVEDTLPGEIGVWECEECGGEIRGERMEPPLSHITDCEDAGPNSLSFRGTSD